MLSEESSEEESEYENEPASGAVAERGTDRVVGATEVRDAAYQTNSEESSEEEFDSGSESTGKEKIPAAAPVKRSAAGGGVGGVGTGAEARGGTQATDESSSDEDASGESEDEAPSARLAEAQGRTPEEKRRGLPEKSSSDGESDDG